MTRNTPVLSVSAKHSQRGGTGNLPILGSLSNDFLLLWERSKYWAKNAKVPSLTPSDAGGNYGFLARKANTAQKDEGERRRILGAVGDYLGGKGKVKAGRKPGPGQGRLF